VCGRYTNTLSRGDLEEHFRTSIATDLGSRRYNIAPTEEILAIVRDKQGDRQARAVRWGLVPWWSKDTKGAARMINARAETVATKPAFRELVGSPAGRALIPADGWFEWLRAEDPKQPRQPFRFVVDGGGPFAFAGLWTRAKIGGERVETAAIITCSARSNRVAAAIHDRMPVVLPDADAEQAWLSDGLDASSAVTLCRALPAERLQAVPANPRVNKSGLDDEGPDLLVAPMAA
jgi:putative SOS response-associated peptidase YedK